MTSAHPDLVLRAMETGEPYPVRALIVNATNPLLTYADTHRVFNALMGLDLIVVLDYYLTPTASIADFVLPCAGADRAPALPAAWRRREHRLRRPCGGRAVLRAQKRLRHLPRFGNSPGAGRGMAARDVQGCA